MMKATTQAGHLKEMKIKKSKYLHNYTRKGVRRMKKNKIAYEEAELNVLQFGIADVIATSSPYEEGGDMGDWTPPRD